jgi:DNA (cytosine-5)-methyltransferase 1
MLLQGFPSSFVLEGTLSSQVEQVSNAVPPPLAKALAVAIKSAMRRVSRASAKETVLSA